MNKNELIELAQSLIKIPSNTGNEEKIELDKEKVGFKDSVNAVRKSRYLVLIAAIVIITCIIATFIDFQFCSKVEDHFGFNRFLLGKENMQAFFALFYGGLTTFAFFLQLEYKHGDKGLSDAGNIEYHFRGKLFRWFRVTAYPGP